MSGKAEDKAIKAAEKYDYSKEEEATTNAKPENKKYGVGGTGEDGGDSTAATVEDGGANDPEEDGEYKPS